MIFRILNQIPCNHYFIFFEAVSELIFLDGYMCVTVVQDTLSTVAAKSIKWKAFCLQNKSIPHTVQRFSTTFDNASVVVEPRFFCHLFHCNGHITIDSNNRESYFVENLSHYN